MADAPVRIEYDDDKHRYTVNGESVPSVTTVLDATEAAPALPWWGMRVGIAAVVQLLQLGRLTWPVLQSIEDPEAIYNRRRPGHDAVKSVVEKLVIANKMSTNHIKDEAGTRGTSIHVAAEALGHGRRIDIAAFPEDDQGYISALLGYWLEQEPNVLEQEVIVASAKHKFAGRFDAIEQEDGYDGLTLTDYKTSSGIWPKYHHQVAAYELGWLECGGAPIASHKLVHLRHDGGYTVVRGRSRPEWFLARLASYNADIALAAELKPPKRARSPKSKTQEQIAA